MSNNDTTPVEPTGTPEPTGAPAPIALTKPAEPSAVPEPVEQSAADSAAPPADAPPAEAPDAPPAEAPDAPHAEAPAGDPYDIWAAPPVPAAPRRDRATVLRLFAAAAVLVVTATATAVAVTLPDRTDVPGLATPNDGRYAFPQLALPPLPTGGKLPGELRGRHQADLRGLLLPAPKEAFPAKPTASPSATASGSPSASASASASASPSTATASASAAVVSPPPVVGRWVPCDSEGVLGRNAAEVNPRLTENACRGVAAQGWATKDGTRTEIRLVKLGSQEEAGNLYDRLAGMSGTKNIESSRLDSAADYPVAGGTVMARVSDAKAGGLPTGRIGYLQSGDVLMILEMTNPKGVPLQPFRQVIVLQSGLLA